MVNAIAATRLQGVEGSPRRALRLRLTLGRYGAMTVEQARAAALTGLARIGLDQTRKLARQAEDVTPAGEDEDESDGAPLPAEAAPQPL